MTKDAVLEHWNQRAVLAEKAGSNDLIAKKLEIQAISKHIKNGMTVAEFGCGNGETAFELLKRYDIDLHCFDFSPSMIDAARALARERGIEKKVQFDVCDVRDQPTIGKCFDAIYSERMVINLPDWEVQSSAIKYLTGLLNPGGRYLMCENSENGLASLNQLRTDSGLPKIAPPWHNKYLSDERVASLLLQGARLVDVESFSSTYYFLSRVVNAWLSMKEGTPLAYDALVNQLAMELPAFGDCSQGKLWIFEKSFT